MQDEWTLSRGEMEERISKLEASSLNTELVILSKVDIAKKKLSDTKFCIVTNVKNRWTENNNIALLGREGT